MSTALPEQAVRFFRTRMRRWFDLAEENPSLTEVLYDGDGELVLDIGGELIPEEGHGLDDGAILALAGNCAVAADTEFHRDQPFLSVLVPPNFRVTFLRPPAVARPVMAMRRLMREPIPLARYVKDGIMSEAQAEELRRMVIERKTLAISGAVGAGKTTLARTLLGFIPVNERIVTIEDPAELSLTAEDGVTRRPHWVALEAVHGVMDMAACLRAALRLRPDRIIVGEVRGPEALELVRSLNTGSEGSLFTLHSNGAREALDRLHTLVLQAQPTYRFETVERCIDAVAHIEGRGRHRRIRGIWRNEHAAS